MHAQYSRQSKRQKRQKREFKHWTKLRPRFEQRRFKPKKLFSVKEIFQRLRGQSVFSRIYAFHRFLLTNRLQRLYLFRRYKFLFHRRAFLLAHRVRQRRRQYYYLSRKRRRRVRLIVKRKKFGVTQLPYAEVSLRPERRSYAPINFRSFCRKRQFIMSHWCRAFSIYKRKKMIRSQVHSFSRRVGFNNVNALRSFFLSRLLNSASLLSLAPDSFFARSLVTQGRVLINGRFTKDPTAPLKTGDIITLSTCFGHRIFAPLTSRLLMDLILFQPRFSVFAVSRLPYFLLQPWFKRAKDISIVIASLWRNPVSKLFVQPLSIFFHGIRRAKYWSHLLNFIRSSRFFFEHKKFGFVSADRLRNLYYSFVLSRLWKPYWNPSVDRCVVARGLQLVAQGLFLNSSLSRSFSLYLSSSLRRWRYYRRLSLLSYKRKVVHFSPYGLLEHCDRRLMRFVDRQRLFKRYLFNRAFLFRYLTNLGFSLGGARRRYGGISKNDIESSRRLLSVMQIRASTQAELPDVSWTIQPSFRGRRVQRWYSRAPWYLKHLVVIPFFFRKRFRHRRISRYGLYDRPLNFASRLRRRQGYYYFRQVRTFRFAPFLLRKIVRYFRGRFRWESSSFFLLLTKAYWLLPHGRMALWSSHLSRTKYHQRFDIFLSRRKRIGHLVVRSNYEVGKELQARAASNFFRDFSFLQSGGARTQYLFYLASRSRRRDVSSHTYKILGPSLFGFFYGLRAPLKLQLFSRRYRPRRFSFRVKKFRAFVKKKAVPLFSLLRFRRRRVLRGLVFRRRARALSVIRCYRDRTRVKYLGLQSVPLRNLFDVLASYLLCMAR